MSDPKKAVAEAIDNDETEIDNDASASQQDGDGHDPDAGDEDAIDGEPDDGVEDIGDAADEADDDGLEAAGADARHGADEGKPVSRGQRRFQELSNRARAAEEKAAQVERDLAALRAERAERQTAAQREEEAERLRLMDPAERAEYRASKLEERFGQELGKLQFQQQDTADRTRFEGFIARRPEFEKFNDEVERELGALRRSGLNVPRETVLWTIVGRNAVKKAPAAKTRAAKRGAENIQRQTARPARSGGDVQRTNSRSGSDADKRRGRLENMEI